MKYNRIFLRLLSAILIKDFHDSEINHRDRSLTNQGLAMLMFCTIKLNVSAMRFLQQPYVVHCPFSEACERR